MTAFPYRAPALRDPASKVAGMLPFLGFLLEVEYLPFEVDSWVFLRSVSCRSPLCGFRPDEAISLAVGASATRTWTSERDTREKRSSSVEHGLD
tara:strand:+ start:6241 stop:6522 length:282 start_codon:yes stop_codon:yes gene_type:complete